jgi:hypothetical protein
MPASPEIATTWTEPPAARLSAKDAQLRDTANQGTRCPNVHDGTHCQSSPSASRRRKPRRGLPRRHNTSSHYWGLVSAGENHNEAVRRM